METNVAYLHNSESVVKDLTKPLLISSCGYYKVVSGRIIKTNRPKGRRDYQLLYIAEGEGRFYFNGVEKRVPKGNIVLFRPMQPQSYFYYPSDKCEVYWVHFTGNMVDEILDHYSIPKDKTIFYAGVYADYQWIFNQMIRELQFCRHGYGEILTFSLRHILTIIERHLVEGNKTGFESINDVEKAVHYFNQHFTENINIDEFAKSLNMSTCWFIRRFKQIMKVTPLQYVLSLKMNLAKEHLEYSDMNVSEIAISVGYDNVLYFSRLFSKHAGMSPSEYKRQFSAK